MRILFFNMTTAEELRKKLEPHWLYVEQRFSKVMLTNLDGSKFPQYNSDAKDFIERCVYQAACDFYDVERGPFYVFYFCNDVPIAARSRDDACKILVKAYDYQPFPERAKKEAQENLIEKERMKKHERLIIERDMPF